ncbi:hypothetical protein [Parapedobacter sp. 10938]|uniref:hypothetical protein n=1 Tax=Parapedobacter flavus TaxID=3110225 RepID=UPI002DB605CB|nr:hypothetical protein [Parapedobacter sp. 10938]MEC3880371.1 hypothetical protein [Parapedobacter sp. 10938]
MNCFKKGTLRRTWVLGIVSVAVATTALTGCKKANPLGLGGCDDLVKKSEQFSKAALAFSEDMSVANCQKYKKAGEDYLKAARKCNMYPELREAAEEAMEEWGDMDCSEISNQ